MGLQIRPAQRADAPRLAALIGQLAASIGESSPLTEEYVQRYLDWPGCDILVAEEGDQVVGLLSYSLHPNLYHAGQVGLIEEFVVDAAVRHRGVGSALMDRLLQQLVAQGCVEVSVSTLLSNLKAISFYRAHGFQDEALLLERHF